VGSDAAGVECTAERAGDAYRLTGSKIMITNGTIAGTGVVIARV
jgi:alkylation response protein AidB-like acyl-CoA dehydrogenase